MNQYQEKQLNLNLAMISLPNKREKRIVFVGGGSVGHVAPLLAVMQEVNTQHPEIKLIYIGTQADLESPLLTSSKLPIETHAIEAGKINRFVTIKHLSELRKLCLGLLQAQVLLEKIQPDLVFAKGAYVSVPVVLAAALRAIPIYTHETDVVPGLANRLSSHFAQTIFTAFPIDCYTSLPKQKLLYMGQPVRKEFLKHSTARMFNDLSLSDPLITVTGGSLGSRSINALISEGWSSLLPYTQLAHLCGEADFNMLTKKAGQLPAELRKKLLLTPFVTHGLPDLFQHSQVVVSRAGGTIAELAACGASTILIPLPTAAQNHQWANARVLMAAEAVEVCDELTMSSENLVKEILALQNDSARRVALSNAIHKFAKPNAAEEMAILICSRIE